MSQNARRKRGRKGAVSVLCPLLQPAVFLVTGNPQIELKNKIVSTALHRASVHRPTLGGSHEWTHWGMRSTQAALKRSFLPNLGISDRDLHSGKSAQCHKMSNVGAGRSETTLIQARLKDIICISGITVSLWSVITRYMETKKLCAFTKGKQQWHTPWYLSYSKPWIEFITFVTISKQDNCNVYYCNLLKKELLKKFTSKKLNINITDANWIFSSPL